ncbi:MAG: geranylgeranylglyceryl/heptaprenylglyceryl phosphate synthase [candidate division WOR-3 bacterium]
MNLYEKLFLKGDKKKILALLDPDKLEKPKLESLIEEINRSQKVVACLVGSSLIVNSDIDAFVYEVKSKTQKPVILFPGSHAQLTKHADAVLFLSLLSGRNAQYLIDEQVRMAPILRKFNLEAISTAYLLIESGRTTTVEWVTNTRPIPRNKVDLVIAHVLAAEMMGFKLIYLEAGSGAEKPVPDELIKLVKANINIPLIVGGGLKSLDTINGVFEAGADFVVIGNKLEEDPKFLRSLI